MVEVAARVCRRRRCRAELFLLLSSWLMAQPTLASGPAWLSAGDPATREAVERLVDQRVINVPVMAWPLPAGDLRWQLERARARGALTPAQSAAIDYLETSLSGKRNWHLAAAEPELLRTYANTPRERGEAGLQLDWSHGDRFSASLRIAAVTTDEDTQVVRPDGSYVAARVGNWLWTAGWQDRWWGPGYDGNVILSNNARPVLAIAVDRGTSAPFNSRWLHWLGPWTFGTFMGALERDRSDVDKAMLWGMRASIRPFSRGLEIGVTRTAQWCGDGRPCGAGTFWDLVTGRDNRGLNVDPDREPGNQLASVDVRWGGRIGRLPLSVYWQHAGEDFDQQVPRPLKGINVVGLSTWGDTLSGTRWRLHAEYATSICSDWDSNRNPIYDCAYENSIFTAGYRYRGRALGLSLDGDSRQWSAGITATTLSQWTLDARLRRAQINLAGLPQANHTISPTPESRWGADATLNGAWRDSQLTFGIGINRIHSAARRDAALDATLFARWQRAF